MKFELSKVYEPKKVEERIYNLWLKSSFFNPDKLPRHHRKSYSIVIPPPNITGELHMGHTLNAVVQDILIRQKRMQGFKTLWLPGTDHAGIATQNVVEKELKKEGLTRFDLGREKFLKRVWQWKEKYGNIILDQFKKIGSSLDWSRTVFTLDKKYSEAVKKAFLHYYKKNWIYQGKRVINWCPRCQTSLSDLEIEHKEEKGKLWYIKYPLAENPKSNHRPALSTKGRGGVAQPRPFEKGRGCGKIQNFITVATTRPETMLGDTAVAVNPKDRRYKNFVRGRLSVMLPLVNRKIPIIADKLVDPKFGTGAVKVTPAHDLTDYEISLRHNLPMIQVINEEAKITKEAPLPYQGLKVLEARKKVIEDLENQNFLEKIEDYIYSLPRCHRCATILELIPSQQWFLKMAELAKMAEFAVKKGKIKFHPKSFEKGYLAWLRNIKDWCISRQIWWGHQLPVWQCQRERNSQFPIPNSQPNKEYFISLEKPKKCQICNKCQPKQVSDVLDTWFSSALWPFAVFGWPKKTKDFKKFYPTDVLSTGRDIINLWVARMIFSGMELVKKIPFKNVYIHPTVLTKEGKRMSKSLGTGINPINLIEKYGADATRFGIAWQISGGQDIRFGEDNIVMGRKFCNKIWNASRFVLLQNPKSKIPAPKQVWYGTDKNQNENLKFKKKNLTSADKRILNALDKTIKSVNKDLESFRFGKAAQTLYNFFWHDFCDKYIEEFKNQEIRVHPSPALSAKGRGWGESQKILFYVLLTSLKLLHPFIPFITEEIYQKLPIKKKGQSLMVEKWPE